MYLGHTWNRLFKHKKYKILGLHYFKNVIQKCHKNVSVWYGILNAYQKNQVMGLGKYMEEERYKILR